LHDPGGRSRTGARVSRCRQHGAGYHRVIRTRRRCGVISHSLRMARFSPRPASTSVSEFTGSTAPGASPTYHSQILRPDRLCVDGAYRCVGGRHRTP
jgi:hypothetical protein